MPQVQTVPIPLLNPSLEAILAPWCFVLSVLPSLHSTACKLNYLWKRCSIISKRPHIPNLFSNHYPNILAVKAFSLRTKAVRLHSQTVDIYSLLFKVFQPPEPFIPLIPGPVIPITWHTSEITTSVTTLHQYNPQYASLPTLPLWILCSWENPYPNPLHFFLLHFPLSQPKVQRSNTATNLSYPKLSGSCLPSTAFSWKTFCGSKYSYSLGSHSLDPPLKNP